LKTQKEKEKEKRKKKKKSIPSVTDTFASFIVLFVATVLLPHKGNLQSGQLHTSTDPPATAKKMVGGKR
jgi:hypothetical protein